MNKVKRYRALYDSHPYESVDGEYVLASDYEVVEAERDTWEREANTAAEQAEHKWARKIDAMKAERDLLLSVANAVEKHASDCWIGCRRDGGPEKPWIPFDETPESIRLALDAWKRAQEVKR